MPTNIRKLKTLSDQLYGHEKDIVRRLGYLIIKKLAGVAVLEANRTYDLAFKRTEKYRKRCFATFITYTLKGDGPWNENDVPNTVVVQVRVRGEDELHKVEALLDRDLYEDRWENSAKGFFNFRLYNSNISYIQNAFQTVKKAYDLI